MRSSSYNIHQLRSKVCFAWNSRSIGKLIISLWGVRPLSLWPRRIDEQKLQHPPTVMNALPMVIIERLPLLLLLPLCPLSGSRPAPRCDNVIRNHDGIHFGTCFPIKLFPLFLLVSISFRSSGCQGLLDCYFGCSRRVFVCVSVCDTKHWCK